MGDAFTKIPNKLCPRCGKLFFGLRNLKWCPECADPEIRHTECQQKQENLRCVGCAGWMITTDPSWPVCAECYPSYHTKGRWSRRGWIRWITGESLGIERPTATAARFKREPWVEHCAHCEMPFETASYNAKWCPGCRASIPVHKRRGAKVYDLKCVRCWAPFPDTRRHQEYCLSCETKVRRQAEYRRRKARLEAAERKAIPEAERQYRKTCNECGVEYWSEGRSARFCPECGLNRRHASIRASIQRRKDRGGKTLAELGQGDGRGRPRKVDASPVVCEAEGMFSKSYRGRRSRAERVLEAATGAKEVRRDVSVAGVHVAEIRADGGGEVPRRTPRDDDEPDEKQPPEDGEEVEDEDGEAGEDEPGPTDDDLATDKCASCGEEVDRPRASGLCFTCSYDLAHQPKK